MGAGTKSVLWVTKNGSGKKNIFQKKLNKSETSPTHAAHKKSSVCKRKRGETQTSSARFSYNKIKIWRIFIKIIWQYFRMILTKITAPGRPPYTLSSSLSPIPLSMMVKLLLALSGMTWMKKFSSPSRTDLSVRDWYRILSRASDEFEISSRRKISLFE